MREVKASGKYPDMIEIVWPYKGDDKGMPSADDDKFMNDVAFKLAEAEEADKTAYMVALYTGNNIFTMTFYTSDIERFAAVLNETLSCYEQLPIDIGTLEDPAWEEYSYMLEMSGMTE